MTQEQKEALFRDLIRYGTFLSDIEITMGNRFCRIRLIKFSGKEFYAIQLNGELIYFEEANEK